MHRLPPRTAVIAIPSWAVIAAGADLETPAAVVDGNGPRTVVAACSPAAREHGVRPGQRLRDAQRLAPALTVLPRDLDAEARAFEPIVAAAESLVAGVEVVRPGLIALDARGPSRYHGGELRLATLLRDAVAELTTATGSPIGSGTACADGLFAAALGAREHADEPRIIPPGGSPAYLASFGLGVLGRPALADTLERLGVRTLGAFAALPAADVANRFGADGAQAHRLSRGLDPRPPAARVPAQDLAVEHEFDPPAERDDAVVFTAKALAERLHTTLSAAGVTCVRLGIELTTVSGRFCFRLWRHGDATGGSLSALAVAQRTRWTLDGWRTQHADAAQGEADPVALLRLVPDSLVLDTGAQQTLWGREEIPNRVARAAERVQVTLGHEAVRRPYLHGGRDPASRTGSVPWGELPAADDHLSAPWPGAVPAPFPALIPVQPYPAELIDAGGSQVAVAGRAHLSAAPAVLTVHGQSLRITGWAGPWPYQERSWDPATARRRARMQVATQDGRGWLLAVEGGTWQVEGVYQ